MLECPTSELRTTSELSLKVATSACNLIKGGHGRCTEDCLIRRLSKHDDNNIATNKTKPRRAQICRDWSPRRDQRAGTNKSPSSPCHWLEAKSFKPHRGHPISKFEIRDCVPHRYEQQQESWRRKVRPIFRSEASLGCE